MSNLWRKNTRRKIIRQRRLTCPSVPMRRSRTDYQLQPNNIHNENCTEVKN